MFIVVEGKDGVGKGTQVRLLIEWLKSLGYVVFETREPTDGPYGQEIRSILNDEKPMPQDPTKFQMLYVYDRIWDEIEIRKAVEQKRVAVCDRYYYSTYAYGKASGADVERLRKENRMFLRPDLMIWLNLDSNLARIRMEGRGKMDEHDKDLSFQDRLQEAYLQLIEEFPEAREIDASGTPEEVHQRIREAVEAILPKVE